MQQKAVFLTWPFLLALVVILAALFFMRGSVGASHPDIESLRWYPKTRQLAKRESSS